MQDLINIQNSEVKGEPSIHTSFRKLSDFAKLHNISGNQVARFFIDLDIEREQWISGIVYQSNETRQIRLAIENNKPHDEIVDLVLTLYEISEKELLYKKRDSQNFHDYLLTDEFRSVLFIISNVCTHGEPILITEVIDESTLSKLLSIQSLEPEAQSAIFNSIVKYITAFCERYGVRAYSKAIENIISSFRIDLEINQNSAAIDEVKKAISEKYIHFTILSSIKSKRDVQLILNNIENNIEDQETLDIILGKITPFLLKELNEGNQEPIFQIFRILIRKGVTIKHLDFIINACEILFKNGESSESSNINIQYIHELLTTSFYRTNIVELIFNNITENDYRKEDISIYNFLRLCAVAQSVDHRNFINQVKTYLSNQEDPYKIFPRIKEVIAMREIVSDRDIDENFVCDFRMSPDFWYECGRVYGEIIDLKTIEKVLTGYSEYPYDMQTMWSEFLTGIIQRYINSIHIDKLQHIINSEYCNDEWMAFILKAIAGGYRSRVKV